MSNLHALVEAIRSGNEQETKSILEKNAEFANQYDETGATPLHYLRYAIQQGDTKWVSRFLQRFPGLRDSMDKNGKPFRAIAIESGNKEVIQLFQ